MVFASFSSSRRFRTRKFLPKREKEFTQFLDNLFSGFFLLPLLLLFAPVATMPAIGSPSVVFNVVNLMLHLSHEQTARNETATPSPPAHESCHQLYHQEVCFSLQYPWESPSRPVVVPPMGPDEIRTSFTLFTRENRTHPVVLDTENLSTVLEAPIRIGKPFKIISHGYLSYGEVGWIKLLVGELLRSDDCNVVVVDWGAGARPPYAQSVANIRLVGHQLGYLIYSLYYYADIDLNQVHLIGHSLGAHLCSYAGSLLKEVYQLQVGRITGLDPAEPYFNDTQPVTRLDPSDAKLVDVIHTDDTPLLGLPLSLGMTIPIGHLDFYPNGGERQPGCSSSDLHCQHHRAIVLFTESIRQSCPLVAVVCDSYASFRAGKCWGCDDEHPCLSMGANIRQIQNSPRKLPTDEASRMRRAQTSNTITETEVKLSRAFLMTGGKSPYCGYHYRVSVTVSNSTQSQRHDGEFGIVHVQFEGTKYKSDFVSLTDKSIYYGAGNTYRSVVILDDLGDLKSVKVTFVYPGSFINIISWRLNRPILHLESLTIEPLAKDYSWNYCFNDPVQVSGKEYALSEKKVC
ncbi:pancreatic lipase-related protein 2-like [Oratosquilla oratoria]|uniref:pancreatic lipase-related protein 2-like n=1 Tax=Oratosquilla oratoria TaxID=337810 RepID=UPI003F77487C